ncbi:MAG: PH domain-containing protein [Anaerolineales bacterium]
MLTRFPAVRTRPLILHILLGVFLCGLISAAGWRLFAFPPDPIGAAGLFIAVAGFFLLPAVLYRIVFLLNAGYEISASGSLTLRFGSWREVLPIEEIEEIRSGSRISTALRASAPGWLEMWHGRAAAEDDAAVDWLATDRGQRLLLLVTKRRRLAISPADPAGFAACLTELSAHGSLEKIGPVSIQPPSILVEILKNPPALALLIGGSVGMAALGAFLTAIQPGLPLDQPFRFDSAGAPTSFGEPGRLLILPLAGGVVWLLNAMLGWWAWKKGQRPSAYALWAVSFIITVGLWAAAVSLITIK